MCHIQLVDTWVLSEMITDLIRECRRMYSRLKFSGRTDYFYQRYNESNGPALCGPSTSPAPPLAQNQM